MYDHVPNESLTADEMPGPEAEVEDLVDFSHSFHGYEVFGSPERTFDEARRIRREHGDRLDRLSVTELRTSLFLLERSCYHAGAVDGPSERRMRELVEAIRRRVLRGEHLDA